MKPNKEIKLAEAKSAAEAVVKALKHMVLMLRIVFGLVSLALIACMFVLVYYDHHVLGILAGLLALYAGSAAVGKAVVQVTPKEGKED